MSDGDAKKQPNAQKQRGADRLLAAAKLVLPLGLATTGVVLFASQGRETFATVFAGLAGAALGLALYLLLGSMALLVGDTETTPPPPDERLQELENTKRMLLRSIRELELDVQLEKLSESDAAELIAPLRKSAVAVLRDIDEARVLLARTSGTAAKLADDAGEDDIVEREIEAELRRRLTTFGH